MRRAAARGRTCELVCAGPRGVRAGGRGAVRARRLGGSRRCWREQPGGAWWVVPRCLPHPGVSGAGTPSPPFPASAERNCHLFSVRAWRRASGGRGRVRLQRVLVLWTLLRFSCPGGSPVAECFSRRGVLLPSGSCFTCSQIGQQRSFAHPPHLRPRGSQARGLKGTEPLG